ncbi:MAG: hypothetical protein JO039_19365 [Solirubrobacterales bacterium]|nr:hypothetical protein [Solirubrobacterales bacterium]
MCALDAVARPHIPEGHYRLLVSLPSNPSDAKRNELRPRRRTRAVNRPRVARRAELIAAMRAKHPGLVETRLIDLGQGAYMDSWRWQDAEEMRAAFAGVATMSEAGAAMSLTRDATADDGVIIDER